MLKVLVGEAVAVEREAVLAAPVQVLLVVAEVGLVEQALMLLLVRPLGEAVERVAVVVLTFLRREEFPITAAVAVVAEEYFRGRAVLAAFPAAVLAVQPVAQVQQVLAPQKVRAVAVAGVLMAALMGLPLAAAAGLFS
jgi:hypothetical protein